MMEYPIGQLDFEGSADGVGQHKRTLKTEVVFSKRARCLQTLRQGIWFVDVFLSHISK